MAQKREVEQWITVNGRHIPVFKGESKEDAVKRMVGKESAPKKESKQESKDTDNEKHYSVNQQSKILDKSQATRLERIKASDEHDAVRKYKEKYPKAKDDNIQVTQTNADGSRYQRSDGSWDDGHMYKAAETKAAPEKQSGSTKSPEFKSYQEAEAYYKDKFANVSSTYANKLAAKLGIEGRGKEKRDAIAKVMAEKWKTSNDISNNEDLKQKQIAQHKQEADKLNGKKDTPEMHKLSNAEHIQNKVSDLNNLHEAAWKSGADKDAIKKQIRQAADALPDGTVLARVKQDTSSTYTSKGVVQSTDTKISKLYKINGQWSRYKDGSGKIDDMASEIIHNSGKLQTLEEAEKQAAKLRETDEIKSKYYGVKEKFESPKYYSESQLKDETFRKDALQEMRRYENNWNFLSSKEKKNISPNGVNELRQRIKEIEDYEKAIKKAEPKKVTPISRQEFEKLSTTEKRSYSADIADQSYREALEEVGLTQDNAHLMTEQQFDKFGRILESKIYKANADLSFQQKMMTKMGVGISGNAGGIASSYRFGDQAPINRAWEEVKMTPNEIREHLKKHKDAGVYEEARYGGVKQGNIERLLATKLGSSYSNHGIGSQASTTQLVVKLYKDKKGNLKLSKHALTWD